MDAWDLLIYLMIFLAIVVGTALAYARMLDWKKKNVRLLEKRLAETENQYNELTKEVGELKLKKNKLRSELQDLKKVREMNQEAPDEGRPKQGIDEQVPDALAFLLKKGVIDQKQIEKARQYLDRGENPWLSVEDAMVMLGFVQSEDLRKAKKKVQKD